MESYVVNRRQVVIGGVIAAFTALWKPIAALADAEPDAAQGANVVLDVACLGHTFTGNLKDALYLDGGDFRGVDFYVEGNLYHSGTLPTGDGFDPASIPAAGHWFCRGHLIFNSDRPLPHTLTLQEYLFDRITPEQPSPPDQLVSSGVEGGIPLATRSVIGGAGRYRGARGEVIQQMLGSNKTRIDSLGMNAPNLRFYFKV
jgi:hypothetical protein